MSHGAVQPEEPGPEPAAAEFADRMRRLVDRSGLSVAAVADATGFARVSWDRYLAGRLLPPRAAVIRLAEVVGEDPARLVALWETAERTWDSPVGAGAPEGRPAPPPRAGSGRPRTGALVGGTIGIALVVLAVVLLIGPGGAKHGDGSAAAPAAPSEPPWSLGTSPSPSPSPRASTSPSATASPPPAAPSAGASPTPRLPAGVRCAPGSCAGKDPQDSGCAGSHARTVADAHVGGALVELRRSDVCRAVWTRVVGAVPGDTLRLQPPSGGAGARVDGGVRTYTAMVDESGTRGVRACLTRRSGTTGCTTGR